MNPERAKCPYCGTDVTHEMKANFHKACSDSETRLDKTPKTIWFRCRSCIKMMGVHIQVSYVIESFELIAQGSGPEW